MNDFTPPSDLQLSLAPSLALSLSRSLSLWGSFTLSLSLSHSFSLTASRPLGPPSLFALLISYYIPSVLYLALACISNPFFRYLSACICPICLLKSNPAKLY